MMSKDELEKQAKAIIDEYTREISGGNAVEVEAKPNAKVPEDILPLIEKQFGSASER